MSAESTRGAPATLGGIPLKHLSLVTLIVQNSALILIMHYSRVMPPVNGQRYFASTSVFLNEVIKLGISLSMALYDLSTKLPPNTTAVALFRNLSSSVFTNESWKLGVPALLYTIQNNLQYVAVSNLDAATFQVTYQLKILTTALFSVLLLGRKLSSRKWLSLFFLIVGVSIVQLPQTSSPEPSGADIVKESTESKVESRSLNGVLHIVGRYVIEQLTKRSATYEGIGDDEKMLHPEMNRSVGLAAVMVSCALSGLAGVFFEKILKDSTTKNVSLWVRNVQLTFWSLFPAFFLGVVIKDGEEIAKAGFFAGYNWVVWTVIIFQAAGGVIVSLVINYADNIAKNFATSISIIASCLASIYFFDFKATLPFFIGTAVVLFATYLYTQPERPSRPAYIRIANYENTTVDGNTVLYDPNKSGAMPRSPRRPEGFQTPLPETPTVEMKQFPKRDD